MNDYYSERRFIRGTFYVTVAVAVLLLMLASRIWFALPDIYLERITTLSKSGDVDAALDKYERLQIILAESIEDETKYICEYEIACGMLNSGRYIEAERFFNTLMDFKDSKEKRKECLYANASHLYDIGEYWDAADMFRSLGVFSNSADRLKDCHAAIAEDLYSAGEYSDAINLLCELDDYNGAADRAYEMALEITGDAERAEEMVSGSITPEEQEKIIAIELARQKLLGGKIAAGRYHSVAVRGDGTVLAVGSNEFGQCDVGGWTDIVAVSAGADFTLGLRRDGTVLAVGNNALGQCNVGEWRDVKKIAAGDYDSFALTTDGKLLFCGYHDYSDVLPAENVRDIFAGGYQGACVLEDGMAVTSHPSSATTFKPVQIALSTALSVNLIWDGSVESRFDRIPEWENIVYLSLNSIGLLGLTTEGEVESFFFRESDSVDFNVSGKYIVAAAAGGEHYLLVDSDGKVYAYGDNTYGQCDVSSWKIK